jgi:hypothetical protein
MVLSAPFPEEVIAQLAPEVKRQMRKELGATFALQVSFLILKPEVALAASLESIVKEELFANLV